MVDEDSDHALVARFRSGDEQAFDELMRRRQRAVLDFVFRLLGDRQEAEDVAQETFVRAYRRLRGFIFGRAAVSTWLFQIARNLALDRLRRRRRRPEQPLADAPEPARSDSAGDQLDQADLGRAIAAAMAGLPEDQRVAIALAEYKGLAMADIARIMHCSSKAVESRLYRARQTLRRQLAGWKM